LLAFWNEHCRCFNGIFKAPHLRAGTLGRAAGGERVRRAVSGLLGSVPAVSAAHRTQRGPVARAPSTAPFLLVAITPEHLDDLRCFGSSEHVRATEVPLPLAGEPHLQVACAGAAMLHLASGGDSETLLDALVGLLLRHD